MLKIPIQYPSISIRFKTIDIMVLLSIIGVLTIIIYVASGWRYEIQPTTDIDLHVSYIPLYAANSVVRIFIAYILSLSFSIWYGYTANRSKLSEKVMIPLLDILQSIPVLSFLPGVVLAMIAIFHDRRLGIELASILLIFTGQVWNMAFSYYISLKTIPRELIEVTRIFRHSRFIRFLKLDLPFSAIGLVWNSMMSVSGGWFFLMACEMFVLKDRDFRLPGLGSYIQTAASHGDMISVLYGLGAMITVIIALDIFFWRPLIAWSQKFRFDPIQAEEERESFVLNILRRSLLVKVISEGVGKIIRLIESRAKRVRTSHYPGFINPLKKAFKLVFLVSAIIALLWSLIRAMMIFSAIPAEEYVSVIISSFYSILRTTTAILLATLWTVPVGVYIGMNPRASRILQPLVQIASSIPATAVFPVILVILIRLGGGLTIGSIFLMLLGTQWYILFNVIAGASAIPQELKDVIKIFRIKGWKRWKTLILPGIFPYLVTGLITATGGAWNATIVSEYVTFGGETIKTKGLGSLIFESTVSGNFHVLLLSTVSMAIIVVSINRLLWKRLFALAEEKYRLD